MQLIASQCRTRGNLGAKIFEGMFAAMPSFASTAAAAVFALNHASCKDITSRYLAAFLNDMTRSAGLVQEMIDGSEEHLQVRRGSLCVYERLAPAEREANQTRSDERRFLILDETDVVGCFFISPAVPFTHREFQSTYPQFKEACSVPGWR